MANLSIQPSTQSTMVACRRTILRWAMPQPSLSLGVPSVCPPNLPACRIVCCTRRATVRAKNMGARRYCCYWSVAANKLEGQSRFAARCFFSHDRAPPCRIRPNFRRFGSRTPNSISNSPWPPSALPRPRPRPRTRSDSRRATTSFGIDARVM